MNRRGFLQLLGALGAAAAIPERVIASADPVLDAAVEETLGEGFWWTPIGDKPVRLNVIGWEAVREVEPLLAEVGGRVRAFPGAARHAVRLNVHGAPFDRHSSPEGAFRAQLAAFRDYVVELPRCRTEYVSTRFEPGDILTQEVELIAMSEATMRFNS